ncbi:MAG: hypothetical protein NWE91_09030 [Candidatus Bathyarchaeota archaeon]|nr:hypothetical protein [Candidatus Bathyarchaeota archaeon]
MVEDVAAWTDGMAIPSRVPDTAISVSSDASGIIQPMLVWSDPLVVGKYDIIVDVNSNGLFDQDMDPLDDSDIEVHAFLMTITPASQSAPAIAWASYTVTVTNLADVEHTVLLQGPLGEKAWLPYCDWTDGPYPFTTEFILAVGEVKDVPLGVRVWDPSAIGGPPYTYLIGVYGYTSLDGYAQTVAIATADHSVVGDYGTISTATGTGTARFASDAGTIVGLEAVDEATLPAEGKPEGVVFPHGLFSFTVEGLTPGQTITMYLELPSSWPIGQPYWKHQEGVGWFPFPIGSDDGDAIITLTLTDGGPTTTTGDGDNTANGVIVEPGGPALVPPEVWSTDLLGSAKGTFLPGDEVYAEGTWFPANTAVAIYFIPDGEEILPEHAVASAIQTTNNAGGLPVTLVWSSPLDLGTYDIWVDVNQNGFFDNGDALTDQALGVYGFNVIPEPAVLVSILLMVGALATYSLASKRKHAID